MRGHAPPWAERLVGQTLGRRYRLDQLIGSGGTGAVYAATHETVGRPVAVKVLSPALATRPDVVERFRQEARAAGAFGGAGVVEVLDMDVEPGIGPYLVLEHLRGESLADRIARRQRLSVSETTELASALLATLGSVHARQIVHRDLKPDNVYFATAADGREHVKLLDFGIARVRDAAIGGALTSAGELLGTPHYMSPEQARGDSDLDARTDLYSVGAIVYECLSGRPPFDAGSLEILLVQVRTQRPAPIAEARPDVPRALVAWLERAMQPSRDARFADAAAMRVELERAVEMSGLARAASSVAPPPAMDTRPGVPGGITPEARATPPTRVASIAVPPSANVATSPVAPQAAQPASRSMLWLVIGIVAVLVGVPCVVAAVIVAGGAVASVAFLNARPPDGRRPDGVVTGPMFVPPGGLLGLANGGPDALRERLDQARELDRGGDYAGAHAAYKEVYQAAFAANQGPDTEMSGIGAEALVALGDLVSRRINPIPAGVDGQPLEEAVDARIDILNEAAGYYGTAQQLDSGRWAYCADVHNGQANQRLGDVIDAVVRASPPGASGVPVSERNAFYGNARDRYREVLTRSAPEGAEPCRADAAAASARVPAPP